MKLKKREITLNETDSLADVYYLEKTLCSAYAEGKAFAERKEALLLLERLHTEGEEEAEYARTLWEKSKKECKIGK